MKKFLFAISLSLGLPLQAQQPADKIKSAEQIYQWLLEARGDSILAHSTPAVRSQITESQVNLLMTQLSFQFGAYKQCDAWQQESLGEFQRHSRRVRFQRGDLLFHLVLDKAGLIAGLNFAPAPKEEEVATAAAFSLPAGAKEEALTLTEGKIQLPAMLTLPRDASAGKRCAAIVLVHGSGPNDRDETIGPNKPFRDLAAALAARGIATLRYDKRTKVYGGQTRTVSGNRLTYDEETVDDAVTALRQLASRPEIDSRRLYVLGHSLGGTLAPRIAEKATAAGHRPAGVIVMAGLVRSFWPTVEEQLRYIAKLQGADSTTAATKAKETAMKMAQGLPAEYLEMVESYDPILTAGKQTSLPYLILQGGHDYQVTMADFELWRKGLAGNEAVTLKAYPQADHLLRKLPQMATPADYMNPGTMMPEVIEDIASFIR